MKIARTFVCCAVIIIALVGRTSAQTFGASDAVEATASGTINWTVGEVYSTGIGAPPPRPVNAAQARAMAERAAFVVAIRNLLETVKGVRVDSETIVENFMTKSDVISTMVDGIVRGARIVKKQYLSDGSVEVLVSMPMRGDFMNAIVPDTFGRTSTTPVPQKPSPAPQKPSEIKPAPSVPEPAKPARSASLRASSAVPAFSTSKPAEASCSSRTRRSFSSSSTTRIRFFMKLMGLSPFILPLDASGLVLKGLRIRLV